MIPTVIRYDASDKRISIVVTVLGQGKLEARHQVYEVSYRTGKTRMIRDTVWSTEEMAIWEWEKWEGR